MAWYLKFKAVVVVIIVAAVMVMIFGRGGDNGSGGDNDGLYGQIHKPYMHINICNISRYTEGES